LPGIKTQGFAAFGHWEKHCVCMSAIASLHIEHMPSGWPSADAAREAIQTDAADAEGRSFPNRAAAVAALQALSDQNFARAQFELGLAYSVGNGVRQSHAMAVAYFEQAAIQSEPGAIFILARYFESGIGGIPVNPERAECCKLAATKSGVGSRAALQT
jgi:TPR repeat protein